MPEPEEGRLTTRALLDAGVFIGALLKGDPRHQESRALVDHARRGDVLACTTPGTLSEVCAALTWEQAQPRHDPAEAARAVQLLVVPPSAIVVLSEDREVALRAVELAALRGLRSRRIHDARHAAAALNAGVSSVYTYDREAWAVFAADGILILGPGTPAPARS